MQDLLNFSFWPDDQIRPLTVNGLTGYCTLPAIMERCTQETGQPFHAYSVNLDDDRDWRMIFRGDTETEIPLLEERIAIIKQASLQMMEKWNGSFMNCLIHAEFKVDRVINLLLQEFPSFQDTAQYRGQTVHLLKRAQILIGDLWWQGGIKFDGLEQLTIFADYRVPQLLATLGIINYHNVAELEAILPNGSELEVEIRSATIQAGHKIMQELGMNNAVLIDYFLWDWAKQLEAKGTMTVPIHRTRCIYY